jgi:hypothetical protein
LPGDKHMVNRGMMPNSRTGPRQWVAAILLLAGAFGAVRLAEGIVCQRVVKSAVSVAATVGSAVPGGGGMANMAAPDPASSATDPAPAPSPVPCGALALAVSLSTAPLLVPGRWTPAPRLVRERLASRSVTPLDRPPRPS